MQYFIVLKLLRLYVTEFFLIILPIFSCLAKKTNKTQKTHWVGFF